MNPTPPWPQIPANGEPDNAEQNIRCCRCNSLSHGVRRITNCDSDENRAEKRERENARCISSDYLDVTCFHLSWSVVRSTGFAFAHSSLFSKCRQPEDCAA